MADDKKTAADIKVIENTVPVAGLSVRSVRVLPDPHNMSPNGLPMDIVEVAFYPLGEGNSTLWMQWADLARFRCERGTADKVLKGLGLEAK